ncbi:tetratricopeptide repeat protein [Laceyella putida]|uniref:Tetratricopeptide repeat protein n=1 Tax=Laceyella putida TaxID=110101 RepID=A0ABW2RJU9_9BACL
MAGPIIELDFKGEIQGKRYVSGSYRRNRAKLERMIKEEPQAEYYLMLAVLEVRKHYWNRAHQAVEKALTLAPDYKEAHLLYAQILEAKQELVEAARAYQATLHRFPQFSKAYREYARYLMTHTDSITLAQSLLLKSLELDPKDALSHILIAEICLLRGKTGQALLHFELAQHYYLDHPRFHQGKARLFMEMERYEEAAKHLKLAMRLDPKNKVLRNQFAQALKATNTPKIFLFWKRWVI